MAHKVNQEKKDPRAVVASAEKEVIKEWRDSDSRDFKDFKDFRVHKV